MDQSQEGRPMSLKMDVFHEGFRHAGWLGGLFLLAFAIAMPLSAQQSGEAKRDPRLDYAGKLIESSSAAKKVEASGNDEAIALREQARGLFDLAVKAQDAGDQATASEYLNQAIRAMQKAVRLSDPDDVTGPKARADFKRVESSVDALNDALLRIGDEKGVKDKIAPITREVASLRGEAGAMFEAGKPAEGRAKLDQALQLLKVNIEGLRGGEELTRSLDFKSKEEEFHYEVDRNDTHQMLVKVFAEEKIKSDSTRKRVEGFLQSALGLRAAADALGKEGQYEAGIGKLEESTKELIKAIRSAGLYIPG
jgi:tetratricopeptide (TPR) repeat protein